MNKETSLMETKKHGSYGYTFEEYNISSPYARQLATNHWHMETEIIYVIKGTLNITINGKSFQGEKGSVFVINSSEMHEISGVTAPLKYYAFVFDFNMLSFKTRDISELNFIEPIINGKIQFHACIEPSQNTIKLLQYIHTINQKSLKAYTLSTKAALLQFFSILIEEKQYSLCEKVSQHTEKDLLLKEIVQYINDNYSNELSLMQISKHFNMSHKYFCRFFKNNFNKTFITYLNDVRMEKAINLLENKNLSITEVALSCGFCNMSYFARTFKKTVGCTPREYKKGVML